MAPEEQNKELMICVTALMRTIKAIPNITFIGSGVATQASSHDVFIRVNQKLAEIEKAGGTMMTLREATHVENESLKLMNGTSFTPRVVHADFGTQILAAEAAEEELEESGLVLDPDFDPNQTL